MTVNVLRVAAARLARWRARKPPRRARFCAACTPSTGERGPELRALLGLPGEERLLTAPAVDATVDSVLEVFPAAGWDEREAHDLYGVRFGGHEPLRALVAHPAQPERWMTPVRGHGPHQVAVGPIHAGVIESGHFRFHVVGERILHLDLRLFYKHRGLERAADGRPLEDGIAYAQRACAACAVTNTVAYAHAGEAALGLAPERACGARARCCSSSSASTTTSTTSRRSAPGSASRRARWRSPRSRSAPSGSTERLTGHRFLFDTVARGSEPGATRRACDATRARRGAGAARRRGRRLARAAVRRLGAGSPQPASASLEPSDAAALGAVGPVARAAGVRHDARADSDPRLWYGDLQPAQPVTPSGDVAARAEIRARRARADLRHPRRAARPSTRARPTSAPTAGGGRSASAASRALAARPSASSKPPTARCAACICAPAPTPTGRCSRTPSPAACSRISR